MTAATPPRRRGHTRWLLVTPLVGLALIVAGAVALEAAAPVVDATDRAVTGLPPLAVEDSPECTRGGIEETVAEDLLEDFSPGGRVTSSQVFSCPAAWDGQDVTYVGEPVGELLPRDGGVWAQVNDDAYALEVGPLVDHRIRSGANSGLTVWLPDGVHERIDAVGRPARRGDIILVRGTLLRTDPADGGGITVRADELEVVAPAIDLANPLHVPQLTAAVVLSILAVGAVVWSRRARRR